MKVINGQTLLNLAPIANMQPKKSHAHGTSWGLSEAGYDIRIKQEIIFTPRESISYIIQENKQIAGRFVIASAMELFHMPDNLVGIVHDKSTWARKGLSVFNTVIEPGWNGYLTLELVFHGREPVVIPAGSGIAQVIFHEIVESRAYSGKYQGQANEPIPSRFE